MDHWIARYTILISVTAWCWIIELDQYDLLWHWNSDAGTTLIDKAVYMLQSRLHQVLCLQNGRNTRLIHKTACMETSQDTSDVMSREILWHNTNLILLLCVILPRDIRVYIYRILLYDQIWFQSFSNALRGKHYV